MITNVPEQEHNRREKVVGVQVEVESIGGGEVRNACSVSPQPATLNNPADRAKDNFRRQELDIAEM